MSTDAMHETTTWPTWTPACLPRHSRAAIWGLSDALMRPCAYLSVPQCTHGPQDAVTAAGPLLCIVGFIVFPLIWSVPEALMTAELATAFPENSGYVAWVTAAFGPMWGFQVRDQGEISSTPLDSDR